MPIIRSSRLYVCYYRLWCAVLWLLVVGGQVQGSRLCVRDEGCCASNIPHSERMVCGFPSKPAYQTVTYTHRVTYTRYRIDKIESPENEPLNARNM